MKKLELNEVEKLYDFFKRKAEISFNKRRYNLALKYIQCCAHIAYDISFRFADETLDNIIYQIASDILKNLTLDSETNNRNRFVLFDCYPNDNRGLSEQYLGALMCNQIEFLYIIENYAPDKTKNIIEKISKYDKADILILDSENSIIEKASVAYKKIVEFQPSKALLHLLPWDVVGCLVFSTLTGIERYMIDLTDHAFWLGINCFDYLIEFRDFGYTIAINRRNVLKEKIIYLPYYPIFVNSNFVGFPFKKRMGQTLLLTGGTYYKTFGDNYKFYEVLKKILENHPSLIVLFVGSGDKKYIDDFIKQNHFEDRLFLLGNRTDIAEVFRHSDIYLSSYPIGGGLMAQLASVSGCAIIAYVNENNPSNYPECMLPKLEKDIKLSYSGNSFFAEIAKLIESPSYRLMKAKQSGNKVPSVEEFNRQFADYVLNKEQTRISCNSIDIDYAYRANLYLSIENEYYFYIPKSILKIFKVRSFILSPALVISYVIEHVCFLLKKLFAR